MRNTEAMLTKMPMKKIDATAMRLRTGISTLRTMAAGRMVHRKSVTVLMIPEKRKKYSVLKQV